MIFDPLREQLIRLAEELQKEDIKLILGGGYGLLLRTEYIQRTEAACEIREHTGRGVRPMISIYF